MLLQTELLYSSLLYDKLSTEHKNTKKDYLQSQSLWYNHNAMYCTCPFLRVSVAEEQNLREYSRAFPMTHCLSYVHLHFSYLCYQYIFHTLGLLLHI